MLHFALFSVAYEGSRVLPAKAKRDRKAAAAAEAAGPAFFPEAEADHEGKREVGGALMANRGLTPHRKKARRRPGTTSRGPGTEPLGSPRPLVSALLTRPSLPGARAELKRRAI